MPRRAARWLIGAIAVLLVTLVVFGLRQPTGEAGPLTETLYTLPSDVPAPLLSDGSSAWGLNSWSSTSRSHLSGGVSPGDLDVDVYGDLVIAGGTVVVFLNGGSRFTLLEDPNTLLPSDALSTLIIDLDADGYGDIVIGSDDGAAVAIWGGPWLRSGGPRQAEVTELAGRSMTTRILAGNLDADATVDLVALG